MSLDQFKCEICKLLPDNDIYNCKNNHIICEKCATKNNRKCDQCKVILIKKPNPLLLKVQNILEPCKHQHTGCSWKFASATMHEHLQECKYRPYYCIGQYLGIWECSWTGIQQDFDSHMTKVHVQFPFFTYFQYASVPFNDKESIKTMNLIEAFNKKFVFYYHADYGKKMVYFLIYLIGRKEDADKFIIDFEIVIPNNDFRKIKFFTDCYTDVEDILEIIENEQCIALSYNVIKNHLHKNEINFRFIITKKNNKDDEKLIKSSNDTNSSSNKKPERFNFKEKGSVKSNIVRTSGSNAPLASSTLSSINKKPVRTVMVESMTKTISSQQLQPPPLPTTDFTDRVSSINSELSPNYGYSSTPESPCFSPAIHRDGFFEDQVKQKVCIKRNSYTNNVSTGLSNQSSLNNNNRVSQGTYRGIGDKSNTRKYPTNCFSKADTRR